MKKVEGRAVLCLILAAALVIGLIVFGVKFVKDGDDWASFYAMLTYIREEGWP